MDILKAAFLGIIEGTTEFIPISSTGHLILFGSWLTFESNSNGTFEIAIQLGAILAVVFLYRDLFIKLCHPSSWFSPMMVKIFIAIVPALGLGFLFYSTIKSLFSPTVVAINLFIGGVLMIIIEKWIKPKAVTSDLESMTYRQAFIVGCCQCCSLIPGMSRSGSTIVGGLVAGCNYETSAKFSFIVAVPVMIAAVSYDLLKSWQGLSQSDLFLIAVGFIVSFFVAALSIVTFLALLKRLKLFPFAIYRILISIAVLLGLHLDF